MIVSQVATEFRAKIFHLERERSLRDVYIKQLMEKINYLSQQLRNSAGPMQFSPSPESIRHAFRNGGTPPRHQESPQIGATGSPPSPITSEGVTEVGHRDAASSTTPSHHRYSDLRQQNDSAVSPTGSGLDPVAPKNADQNNIGRAHPTHTRTHKPRQKTGLGNNGDSDGRSKRGNNPSNSHRKSNQASISATNADNSPQRTNSKKNASKSAHSNRGKGRQRGRGRGRGNQRSSRRSATKKGAQNPKS